MDPREFFEKLPRGKADKPLLFSWGEIIYDRHDIDGLYTMLDKDFSGCILLNFAKSMDASVTGTVTLDGKPVKHCYLKFMPIMNNMWVLAVRVRGLIADDDREYALHVEGYADTDGNTMNPQDFIIKSAPRVYPEAKDAAHEAVALKAAQEGIVLLENKNKVLPLKAGTVLNVFGKAMHQFRVGAVGAGKINPRYIVDFLQAVRESGDYSLNEELVEFYGCDEDLTPDDGCLLRARALSDTAIVMVTRGSGENQDNTTAKGDYYLTDAEDCLIRTVCEKFAHVIVILDVAYPMDVTFVERYAIEGVVLLGLAGMLAGTALLNILSGKVNPSGKLPDTWARDYFEIPASRNFYDSVDKPRLTAESDAYIDTVYEEDIYVGYRYFNTFGKEVAYPFGHGLSYTEFDVCAKLPVFDENRGLSLSVTVKNTGGRPGKEVVQIYVGQPGGSGAPGTDRSAIQSGRAAAGEGPENPERILVAFDKTRLLAPGEEQTFEFIIPPKYMTCFDEAKSAYIMAGGDYKVFAGTSCYAPQCGGFHLNETLIVKPVENLMAPAASIERLSQYAPEKTWPKGRHSGVKEGVCGFAPRGARRTYAPKFSGRRPEPEAALAGEKGLPEPEAACDGANAYPGPKLTYADVKAHPELAEDFVAQMRVAELARISVCGSAGWGMEGIGEAGHIVQLPGYDLPPFPVSDGNSGVNLNVKNIGMPSGATLCASFNKELAAAVGRTIGEEARALGMPMILAPALNIHRNPLNGRQPEYFSEDPYLAGVMAGSYARGMESAGVASCMKHLLANNCESSRKRNMSILSQRVLREIYFRAFEIAMDVHMPAAFMTAYNACNGVPTAADEELLQGLLREECGFDGFIMTDWGTYDTADVAEMVQAGNCWITPGSMDDTYTDQILCGLDTGVISETRLRENVTWIIKTMIRFV